MLLHDLQVTPEDSTLSYLPLAHIFDRIVEEFALYSGARIGYYQVLLRCSCPRCKAHSVQALRKSIFPCSMRCDHTQCGPCAQGSPKKITDDVAALRPTLFIAVPRVLERIQAGIDAKVQPLPDVRLPHGRNSCSFDCACTRPPAGRVAPVRSCNERQGVLAML